jgi:hypothetical protein
MESVTVTSAIVNKKLILMKNANMKHLLDGMFNVLTIGRLLKLLITVIRAERS